LKEPDKSYDCSFLLLRKHDRARYGERVMINVPVLAKILVIFALIVIAASKHVHLGLAAAVGGILIALWQGMNTEGIVNAALMELTNPDLILLVLLLAAIMTFSEAMKISGAMNVFSNTVAKAMPSRRIALGVVPLLIGTLPMPGGAIISAPLVGALNDDDARGPEALSAVNYWFRHILELAWPLFPAFILTSGLTKLPTLTLIGLNIYAPIVLLILGFLFVLPKSRNNSEGAHGSADAIPSLPNAIPLSMATPSSCGRASADSLSGNSISIGEKPSIAEVLHGIAPLGLVLGTYIVIDVIWEALTKNISLSADVKVLLSRYVPIYIGLLIGSWYLIKASGGAWIFKHSLTNSTIDLIAVVIGIRVFSALMTSANLSNEVSLELANAGIPALVVIAVLPFISGIVTGVGMGYVGLSMPIVLALIASSGIPLKAGVMIANAFGYTGMMLSPLHVCMVVTAQHFKSSLIKVILKCALPLAIFLIIVIAYGALLMALMR